MRKLRKKIYFVSIVAILFLCFLFIDQALAQSNEEKQERSDQVEQLLAEPSLGLDITSRIAFFTGYDNNVNLGSTKKGDIFQEYIYSLGISKPICKNLYFTFNYDLDALTYNEITDATNILNHLRLGFLRKTSRFQFATGYDFSSSYYPNDKESQFVFHKFFCYFRDYLFEGFYHQVTWESGLKIHPDKKALDNTISTYQDKDLDDERGTFTYSIGAVLTQKLFLQVKASIIRNDSNAIYLDYYDYMGYRLNPSLYYKLNKKTQLFANFTYLRKNYKARTVTYDTYKQRDILYKMNTGLRYKIGKNNIVSVSYEFRDNSSNDYTQKYADNVFRVGWQYNF